MHPRKTISFGLALVACSPAPAMQGARWVGLPTGQQVSLSEFSTTAEGEEDPSDEDDSDEALSDDAETEILTPFAEARPHPLDGLTDEQIDQLIGANPYNLGPASIGRPSGGGLVNATLAEECEFFRPINQTWGTPETLEYLKASLRAVHQSFPATPQLVLGDISSEQGGRLRPHKSHQSGRDVDISYFYSKSTTPWYTRASTHNLDSARTWAFVRALITEADVEFILIDNSIQTLLRQYALKIGESPEWINTIFKGDAERSRIVRHAPGHATHIHIRFYNPIAQETGRRAYRALAKRQLLDSALGYAMYRAKKGENLEEIARRYNTTIRAIQRANGLNSGRTSGQVKESAVFRIPMQKLPRLPELALEKIKIPPRCLPVERQDDRGSQTFSALK